MAAFGLGYELTPSDIEKTTLRGPFRFPNAKSLAELIYTSSVLTDLDLGGNHLGNYPRNSEAISFFADAINVSKTLTRLNISRNRLSDSDLCLIIRSLPPTLTYLDISYNTLSHTMGIIRCITDMIDTNSSLRTFVLKGVLTDDALSFILNHVSTNTTLTDLNIEDGSIDDNAIMALQEITRNNTTLQRLDLTGCFTEDPEKVKHLIEALTGSNLTSLIMDGTRLNDDCGEPIRDMLRTNTSLTIFDLSNNYIKSSSAFSSIAQGLRDNTTLKTLILNCSDLRLNPPSRERIYDIGVTGINHIADALLENSSLQKLELLGQSGGLEGARHLAQMLIVNKSLLELSYSSILMTEEGNRLIAAGLSGSSLESLYISVASNYTINTFANIADRTATSIYYADDVKGYTKIGDRGGEGVRESGSVTTNDGGDGSYLWCLIQRLY